MALDQIDIDKINLEEYKKGNVVQEEQDMSFIEHLEELRWMLIRAIGGVLITTILVFAFRKFFIDFLTFGPTQADFIGYDILCNLSGLINSDVLCFKNDLTLQNMKLAGQFTEHLKMSMIWGFMLAFPWVFWQVWRFIKPALYEKEQKAMHGVTLASWVFFFIGTAFGYLIILPFSINFLFNYTFSNAITNIYTISDYVSVLTGIVLSTGLMFELPMIIFLLSKIGLVNPTILRQQRKLAFVIILGVSAIITPPDLFSMVLITLPIYGLYEISIAISGWVFKQNETENN